jgi:hypothetical protein
VGSADPPQRGFDVTEFAARDGEAVGDPFDPDVGSQREQHQK